MKRKIAFIFSLVLVLAGPWMPYATAAELPAVKTYEELKHAVSRVRIENRVRTGDATGKERVREAWEIGRLLDAHVLQQKGTADYDKQVTARLAGDLGMSDREIYDMLGFYRAYPVLPEDSGLKWPEYRKRLSASGTKQRESLTRKAVTEGASQDRPKEETPTPKRSVPSEETPPPVTRDLISPVPHSGPPRTYRIIVPTAGPYAGELALDLGFSNYARLTNEVGDLTPFTEGEIVAFSEESSEVLESNESELYTYRAWVYRVVDGDTFGALIDLGFGLTTTQTFRLRGIEVPDIKTHDGMEAKKFLESILISQGRTPQPVFIKTSKVDKDNRYLADVFITAKNGEEQYLNNLLLEKGYAVKIKE